MGTTCNLTAAKSGNPGRLIRIPVSLSPYRSYTCQETRVINKKMGKDRGANWESTSAEWKSLDGY